ncbi:MAG TPA: endonuclease/exonuclease/phosphatase family protein [Candidatus Limnocylindria bacterium]|nr:endonuclease/exonuclease/phosphatase family protein [Candidatus Limnocylindria bacterium]
MAKVFSIASWNVEHFKDDLTRVGKVIDLVKAQNPDVFGLYEVEGARVFNALVDKMPNYTFQITEGLQTQEILVGVSKQLTAFITQKTEFRSGTTHMRPGQLVTIVTNGKNYALLFLHLSSGTDPRGMGLRDDMLERAFEFRKILDSAEGGPGKARYLFLGDFNTMGMKYPFDRSILADVELKKWDNYAARPTIAMRRLKKSHDATFFNGSTSSFPPSNLDNVYASKNLRFKTFSHATTGTPVEVDVRGWVNEPTDAKKDEWIGMFSDHSLLYFEIHD